MLFEGPVIIMRRGGGYKMENVLIRYLVCSLPQPLDRVKHFATFCAPFQYRLNFRLPH